MLSGCVHAASSAATAEAVAVRGATIPLRATPKEGRMRSTAGTTPRAYVRRAQATGSSVYSAGPVIPKKNFEPLIRARARRGGPTVGPAIRAGTVLCASVSPTLYSWPHTALSRGVCRGRRR